MDYLCAKFGDFSFSRFFIVQTDRNTEGAVLTHLPSAWVIIVTVKLLFKASCYKTWQRVHFHFLTLLRKMLLSPCLTYGTLNNHCTINLSAHKNLTLTSTNCHLLNFTLAHCLVLLTLLSSITAVQKFVTVFLVRNYMYCLSSRLLLMLFFCWCCFCQKATRMWHLRSVRLILFLL